MGDRCYMRVTCRRQDVPRFEPLGFVVDYEADASHPIVELIDEDANYAHHGRLPADVPFLAEHGPGGNFGNGLVACDGHRLADIEAGHEGGFVITWDAQKDAPAAGSLAAIREYRSVRRAAEELFERLAAPAPA